MLASSRSAMRSRCSEMTMNSRPTSAPAEPPIITKRSRQSSGLPGMSMADRLARRLRRTDVVQAEVAERDRLAGAVEDDRAQFVDRAGVGRLEGLGGLHRLLQGLAIQDVEAEQAFLGFGERPVGDQALAAHGDRLARGAEPGGGT